MPNIRENDSEVLIPHEVVVLCAVKGLSPIAAWRVYKGVSQNELANKIGVTLPVLTLLEQQGTKPTVDELEKVANSLGIQRAQLELVD
ncbi:MAG: helix-turn-helix transcriptional regulator [Pseudomonadota bacterium]|nr:helix-turn-helix transcriptional regulator [Pseudomonadota bacterium]